ncbi:MAG: hypothetical protein RhofKO_15050 [Rhodothermales bacterium]
MSGKGQALIIGIALSIVLHLLLGWAWTIIAAVAGGYLAHRGGWWVGMLTLLVGWGSLLLGFTLLDGQSVRATMEIMGGILGGVPGLAVVIAPLLIASILGVLGGAAGSAAAYLRHGEQPVRRFTSSRFTAQRPSLSIARPGRKKPGKYAR